MSYFAPLEYSSQQTFSQYSAKNPQKPNYFRARSSVVFDWCWAILLSSCFRNETDLDNTATGPGKKRVGTLFGEKGTQTFFLCPPVRERRADLALLVNHYGDGHRRDVRSEHGQQLGDSDNEVGKIVTLDR